MKKKMCAVIGMLFVCILMSSPPVAAEIISDWAPDWYDYGDVEVEGMSVSQIFTVTVGAGLLEFYEATLVANDNTEGDPEPYMGPSFTITASPNPHEVFPATESFYIEVTFAPDVTGYHYAYLRILSNESGYYDDIRIPLFGMGVAAPTPPGDPMADLLAFFNASVLDGTIYGIGSGNSAGGRLKAFGNMLKATNDLFIAGETELACSQLQDALNRADGFEPPPDFVDGTNRDTLQGMIIDIMGDVCP